MPIIAALLGLSAAHATASSALSRSAWGAQAHTRLRTRAGPHMTLLGENQRHFLHVDDLSPLELRHVLDSAHEIKALLKTGSRQYRPFAGTTLAMVFAKPSCRTRVSFETGMSLLGGHALCLGDEVGIGTREAVKDVSRVLASMNDMIMARLFKHGDLLELAQYSKVRPGREDVPRVAAPRR